jgi:hypothetical protein
MRQKFQWEVSKSKHDAHDELLSCLELLTKYYKTPCSKQIERKQEQTCTS